jgi:cell division protein FtsQ
MARLDRLPWRVLAGVALALIGLTLGWLWFRDSSFVAVERVSITGSTSSEDAQVRETLEVTAAGMSTLKVDEDALRESVEPFSSVADLRIKADFPHDLVIEVVEHEPVANVEAGGSRVPATGGGLLLDGIQTDDLPEVRSPR